VVIPVVVIPVAVILAAVLLSPKAQETNLVAEIPAVETLVAEIPSQAHEIIRLNQTFSRVKLKQNNSSKVSFQFVVSILALKR
jgi:hypothetical protein